jgi:hypothetical protein
VNKYKLFAQRAQARQQQAPANTNQQPAPAIVKTPPSANRIINLTEDAFAAGEHYIVEMLRGHETTLLMSGSPGTGKTFRMNRAAEHETRNDRLYWKVARGTDGKWADERLTRYAQGGAYTFGPRWHIPGEDGEPTFHPRYYVLEGHTTPAAMVGYLHEYNQRGELLIGDDLDIPRSGPAYFLLLHATDSRKKRRIQWASTRKLPNVPWRSGVVPAHFFTEGAFAVTTNKRFEEIPEALLSRLTPIRIPINSREDEHHWLRHVAYHGALTDFTAAEIADALDYIANFIFPVKGRRLTVRTLVAVARLRQRQPERWRKLAEAISF